MVNTDLINHWRQPKSLSDFIFRKRRCYVCRKIISNEKDWQERHTYLLTRKTHWLKSNPAKFPHRWTWFEQKTDVLFHNQTQKYRNVVKGVMGRGVKGVRYRSIATKCLRTAAYGESHQKRVRSASHPPPFRCEMFVRCRSWVVCKKFCVTNTVVVVLMCTSRIVEKTPFISRRAVFTVRRTEAESFAEMGQEISRYPKYWGGDIGIE